MVLHRVLLEYLFLVGAGEKQVTERRRHVEGYKEEDENSVAHVSRLKIMPLFVYM